MVGFFKKYEQVMGGVLVIFVLLYALMGFYWPIVEIEGPMILIFAPVVLISCLLFFVAAKVEKYSICGSIRIGFLVGINIAMLVFVSNFVFYEKYYGVCVVTEISAGRGGATNWNVNTATRRNVLLNIRLDDVNISTAPESVELNIYKGWLGFYFAERNNLKGSASINRSH